MSSFSMMISISISAILLAFPPSIQSFTLPSPILLQQQRSSSSSSHLYQSSTSNTPFTNFKLPNPFTENTSTTSTPTPPAPPTLFDRARLLLSCDFSDPTLLDDNFVWISPYATPTTPISKSDFLAASAFFNLRGTFPDWDYRAHDFRLDPDDPLTVRCTVRVVGTMRGGLRVRGEAEEIAANGKRMVCPPEAISMTFSPNSNLLLKLTSNICMDRLCGNTDGLCGLPAAASIAGIPPSPFSLLPPSTIIQRWFMRTPRRIPEPESFLAPFPESVMIQLAKGVLAADNGASDPSLLSPSFEFVGPLVGPVGKDEFVKAFGGFGIKDAFPDLETEYSNFRVDPFDPYRVWVDARGSGTDTGGLAGKEATMKKFVSPPEAVSLTFDDEGICTRLTAGVVMDPTKGNTGGLGGVFGLFYATGNPLPGIVSRSIPDNLARLKKRLLMPITGIDVDDWQIPQPSQPDTLGDTTADDTAADEATTDESTPATPPNLSLPKIDVPKIDIPKINLPSIELPSPTPPSSPPPDTAATKAKQAAQQAKQARQSISDAAKAKAKAQAEKEDAAAKKLQQQQEAAAKKQEQIEAAQLKKEQAAAAAAKLREEKATARREKAAALAKQREEKKAAVAQAQKEKREAALAAAEAKKQKITKTEKQSSSPFDFFKPTTPTKSSSSSPISAKVTAAKQKKDAADAKLKIANKRRDQLKQAAKSSSSTTPPPPPPTKLNRSQTIKLFFARESSSTSDERDTTTPPTAPKGVPIMKRWKINKIDDSITGFISGSDVFDDGEKVTTSTIVGGDLVKGSVVRTSSGSKYYLD